MYFLIKRLSDICGCILLGLIIFLPCVIIALLIKRDSAGPIFYRQERVGRNGEFFRIFKFRTMVQNADQIGSFSTSQNDSRITPLGNLLRKTSVDELPQILNVFIGDMSFIGPRPDVLQQRDLYSEQEFIERHSVRPGITGLAQCVNRHGATIDQRKESDIYYAHNVSFLLDVKIFFMTVKTVFKGSY